MSSSIQKNEQPLINNHTENRMSDFLDRVTCGDCVELMRRLPDESVNMVMFSPPYWGLRDYGIEGQIGLEPTYQEYIAKMVGVGREIKRVLRRDGSWYLNLGDTYSSAMGKHGNRTAGFSEKTMVKDNIKPNRPKDLPSKCKLLMPHRVALALVDDGWICRNDITWFKPNSMPSSVKDRLNTTTEQIFHFVKARRYYYDLDAIRVPHKVAKERFPERKIDYEHKNGPELISSSSRLHFQTKTATAWNPLGKNPGDVSVIPESWGVDKDGEYHGQATKDYESAMAQNPSETKRRIIESQLKHPGRRRNPGDFWSITTKPFPEAHFAVYPEALCERPIKSSCPADGVVLDPMCGAGTTLVVAKKLGRHFIGFDLNPDYCEMARKRLSRVTIPLERFAEGGR